ncbi:MAG: apolipoprotein N-acyltransferase [Alphaproteobacteria bacterium]
MKFTGIFKRMETLTGFKKYATAFLLGAAMVLAMPPIGAFPIMLISVPGFITLARFCEKKRQSFLTGWAFGAGYFIFGLYWVSWSLMVDIAQFGWALPFSFVIGPTVLGLFFGFIPLLARRWSSVEAAHALAFIGAWGAIEWVRGHILTGFPWNLPGYAFDQVLPLMQGAAYVGIYGLSLLALFWMAVPEFTSRRNVFIVALFSFILAAGFGNARLEYNKTEDSGYTVRLVQANIPQKMKWDNDEDWRNLEKHMALGTQDIVAGKEPTFVVWPETAVNADLSQFPEIASIIAKSLPQGATGLLGSLRVDAAKASHPKVYNSMTVMDSNSNVLGHYDKHHLVPFGEYNPFSGLNIPAMAAAMAGVGGFTAGTGPQTMRAGKLPSFSPLVCYEVIFPREVVDQKDRPDWIVNVTNDGWYGMTAGPYQHFASARMRAVEEGLPLARAANTGISGMIDPLGRVVDSVPLGTPGYVQTLLPKPLPRTPYAQFGDAFFFALLLLAAISAEAVLRRKA